MSWPPAFLLALGVCLGSSAFPLEGTAQDSPPPGISAVVQLLAIGPGERGKNRECAATGFFVNEEGYLLTNAHVVEEAQQCLAASPGAKILAKLPRPTSQTATALSCVLVGLDHLHDLAVMKTERPLPPGERHAFVRLDPAEVAEGTPVAVTGHPAFTWRPLTQSGTVIGRGTMRLSERSTDLSEVIVLNIPLRRGNSGSPVYRQAENGVVGVVERRDPVRPAQTVAVPIRYAIELLNRHGVQWHASRE